jgi:hypothetical protein
LWFQISNFEVGGLSGENKKDDNGSGVVEIPGQSIFVAGWG